MDILKDTSRQKKKQIELRMHKVLSDSALKHESEM